jgi:hypothetical protein
MFLIRIVNPTMIEFSASTTAELGGFADFDTRLWLFAASGLGLLANDDDDGPQSTLLDASTDGTRILIDEPGLYFLAVTGTGSAALGDDDDDEIFAFATPTEISGPDGPGGGKPIDDWTSAEDSGSYLIALTGVAFVVLGDLDGDGMVGFADLLLLLSQFGPCNDEDPCLPDFDGSGSVDFGDLLTLLAEWSG